MSKVFLAFGDSWPAGIKLEDKSVAFPVLIANNLGMESNNLSEPATSIEHAVMALLHFLENTYDANDEYIALCCLTDSSRNMIWEPNVGRIIDPPKTFWAPSCFTREIQINNPHPSVAQYYKYIQTDRMDLYNYTKNIIFFQTMCDKFGIKLFFVNNFDMIDLQFKLTKDIVMYGKTLREIVKSSNYKETVDVNKEFQNRTDESKQYIDQAGHPSIDGHKQIANELTEWIKDGIH
jgi:hypothetical protein